MLSSLRESARNDRFPGNGRAALMAGAVGPRIGCHPLINPSVRNAERAQIAGRDRHGLR